MPYIENTGYLLGIRYSFFSIKWANTHPLECFSIPVENISVSHCQGSLLCRNFIFPFHNENASLMGLLSSGLQFRFGKQVFYYFTIGKGGGEQRDICILGVTNGAFGKWEPESARLLFCTISHNCR